MFGRSHPNHDKLKNVSVSPNFLRFKAFLEAYYPSLDLKNLSDSHIHAFAISLESSNKKVSARTKGQYAYAIRGFIQKYFPGSAANEIVGKNAVLISWMAEGVKARNVYAFPKKHKNAAIFQANPPNESLRIFLNFLDKKFKGKYDLAKITKVDIDDFKKYVSGTNGKKLTNQVLFNCVGAIITYITTHFPGSKGEESVLASSALQELHSKSGSGVSKAPQLSTENTKSVSLEQESDSGQSAQETEDYAKSDVYHRLFDVLFPIRDPKDSRRVHPRFSEDGKTCHKNVKIGKINFREYGEIL